MDISTVFPCEGGQKAGPVLWQQRSGFYMCPRNPIDTYFRLVTDLALFPSCEMFGHILLEVKTTILHIDAGCLFHVSTECEKEVLVDICRAQEIFQRRLKSTGKLNLLFS